MNNTLKEYVDYRHNSENKFTMLGIGPMSKKLIQACFELGKEKDFPLMFIASRNQVDADEFGAGYVNGWDQYRFAADLKEMAEKVGFTGDYYLCRDHGGPWQRDKERNDHLPEDKAMELAKISYAHDMKAGFDLLHIDPTKDPYVMGKVIELEVVLKRTVELIEFCESYRKEHGIKEIAYEVGTEETNGGLTSVETFESFIVELNRRLDAKELPRPLFIVGQTGTLTRLTENVGNFNAEQSLVLADIAEKHGMGLKEHNGDYLSDVTLLKHPALNITAMNVAPEYGTIETRAYLELHKVEQELAENKLIDHCSKLYSSLAKSCVNSGKWKKWMTAEHKDKSADEIFNDSELLQTIVELSGHYCYDEEVIAKELSTMSKNLESLGVQPNRYAVNSIKHVIQNEAECFNMVSSSSMTLAHHNKANIQNQQASLM